MTQDSFTNLHSVEDIDWARVWLWQMDEATFAGHGADFWDNWARCLPAKAKHSNYVEELICRLCLSPEYSVLDVGAGTGALTIPLARRVRRVTALDQSSEMLKTVFKNANEAELTNITTLNLDWTKAQIGKDLQRHDVVVVSRSLPSGNDITKSLKLIDAAAKHACYITWKANGYDELESELSELLGIAYFPFPEYIVLYNLLYCMGIHANVELFETRGYRHYETLEEAYLQILKSYQVDASKKHMILDFLNTRLKYRGGLFFQPKNTFWALISWIKDNK